MKDKCMIIEKKIALLFKIVYLILTMMTFNSFTFGKSIMSIFVMLSFLLGILVIGLRIINWKHFIAMPLFGFCIMFCFSFFISMVANMRYGWIDNFKWLVWTVFQLFILYIMDVKSNPQYYKKEIKILSYIIIIYSFLAAVISIILMLIRYQNIVELTDQRVIQGFIWGRLWGAFTDPNYGSVISVISIILSLSLCQYYNNLKKRFFYINIILQLMYIVFSDSRTGLVALFAGLSIYVYTILLRKETKLGGIKKYLKNIACVLLILVITFTGMQLVKTVYNNFAVPILTEVFYSDDSKTEEEEEELARIGREEDINVDPSNRRFDIWESGLEVFQTSPIVGTSYVTFIPYVEDNLPDTYVVNNDHGTFGNMHNEYLNVLVFQGVIGAVALIGFMIRAIYLVFKNIFRVQGQDYYYCCSLLALIVVVAVSMMFILEGVYTNSVAAFVLWSALGYLIHFLKIRSVEEAK